MRIGWFVLVMLYCSHLSAEEVVETRSVQTVALQVHEQSFFTDRTGTAVVYFDTVVEQPENSSAISDTCHVIDIQVMETPDDEKGKSAAMLLFLPMQTGVVTLPSLAFESETAVYQTEPLQIRVGEPVRSPQLSLSLKPEKVQVYAGEPVRVDLTWECGLNAAAIRALRLNPEFFNDPAVQVVIPRNSDAENVQVGLPIGGRRVIATRELSADEGRKQLGVIRLPLYLRFNEAGHYSLPETRLECAVLSKASGDFGRYAAHFNNGLFEAVDAKAVYERVYTTAPAIDIEVLPLPVEQQAASFSGLFAPLEVDVSIRPSDVAIGELMELEVKLSGAAPHGMLELPKLSQQPGLRERFIVDDAYGRLWHESGTTFRTRVRALSTKVKAFPSLQLQVFDPESGEFTMLRTEAIPLQIQPSNGQEFLPLKSFEGAAVTLTNQPEGIWHNREAHPMNDLLNLVYSLVRSAFWPLLILGPIAFVLFLPLVRERRRRALDARYRLRAEAYGEFRRLSGDSRAKWQAFLRFMALTFDAADKTWTRSDSEAALSKVGADAADVEALQAMHAAADAEEFSPQGSGASFNNLDGLAKRITQLAAKSAMLLCILVVWLPGELRADEWAEAEQRFADAQAAPAGSEQAIALYQDAALRAEAAAMANSHPGAAWYNAGNAWFEAGFIGRAIVAYRNAANYMPFDSKLSDNLAAARAMTLNDVPMEQSWWQQLPLGWVKVVLVLVSLIFWACLLLHIRYRHRYWLGATVVLGLGLLVVSGLLLQKQLTAEQAGAVVVDAVYGKKGPGYAFANAFNEPLHDGLEFILVEQRGDWGFIELPDTRQCWLPISQMQLILK